MLKDAAATAALPVQDVERAKAFYEDKLGLTPAEVMGDEGCRYGSGATEFLLFPSSGRPSGEHTQMSFIVDDADAEVAALRAKGVEFEEVPGIDMADGIAEMDAGRGGWFKDSEGNLLGVFEYK